jgi:hypothetical protein
MHALPPKIVYSASVKNSTQEPISVVVSRKDKDGHVTAEPAVDVAPGASANFEKKSVTVELAQFALVVEKVEVKSASGKTIAVAAPFNVASPVNDYKFNITATEAGLAVEHSA